MGDLRLAILVTTVLAGCLQQHAAPSPCTTSSDCPIGQRCVDAVCSVEDASSPTADAIVDAVSDALPPVDGARPPARDASLDVLRDTGEELDGTTDVDGGTVTDAGTDADGSTVIDGATVVDGSTDPGMVEQVFDEPGVYSFRFAAGVTSVEVEAHGAGGGGIETGPWGSAVGGRGGRVVAEVSVVAGTEYLVVVGGGGRGAACGGGTPGSGGGGHSSLLTVEGAPLVSAGGGGGGQNRESGCDANTVCRSACSSAGRGAGGAGFGGGGGRSDSTATHGYPGAAVHDFAGGAVGEGNCADDSGNGGVGGGGGGGGTHNGFGGGGGGGGFPGGCGGDANSAGHGGANAAGPDVIPAVDDALGAVGGEAGADGAAGVVLLRYTIPSS